MLGLGGSALVIVEWGGARPQWDVPQAIGSIPQAGNYDLVVLQYFKPNLVKIETQSSSQS